METLLEKKIVLLKIAPSPSHAKEEFSQVRNKDHHTPRLMSGCPSAIIILQTFSPQEHLLQGIYQTNKINVFWMNYNVSLK